MTGRATLSPATRAGLFTTLMGLNEPQGAKRRREVEVLYRCPDCRELHDWEEDAEQCCADDEEGENPCPVCNKGCEDNHDAANCCLWKDLEPMARYRIAMAVDAGATWAEAIEAETGSRA